MVHSPFLLRRGVISSERTIGLSHSEASSQRGTTGSHPLGGSDLP